MADRARSAALDLAIFRIGLGLFAWFGSRRMNRTFGISRADDSAALDYMNGVFGARAVALGAGYLTAAEQARPQWHRLWLLCDAADTVMGVRMAARGELGPLTAILALAITGGATAIDLAAIGSER